MRQNVHGVPCYTTWDPGDCGYEEEYRFYDWLENQPGWAGAPDLRRSPGNYMISIGLRQAAWADMVSQVGTSQLWELLTGGSPIPGMLREYLSLRKPTAERTSQVLRGAVLSIHEAWVVQSWFWHTRSAVYRNKLMVKLNPGDPGTILKYLRTQGHMSALFRMSRQQVYAVIQAVLEDYNSQ
jgi:hypothetical protein